MAPLEVTNPFCEAKSELKFFESALADVPVIASPTGPFRRAIRHQETGFLASSPDEWQNSLMQLVDDGNLRRRIGRAAHRDVLWRYGPERRAKLGRSLLDLVQGGERAAGAFERHISRSGNDRRIHVRLTEHELVFDSDQLGVAEVTVAIPLYNYENFITEALESVGRQTLKCLDLVIVDDCSTDHSLSVALDWVHANVGRFNEVRVLKNRANSGLALTRNVAFDWADTPWVLVLDADNRLLPDCAAACLHVAKQTGVAFVYPSIQQFGDASELMGMETYDPLRLSIGNYIDAMALVSLAAWASVGGYSPAQGWEDFDFWCRLAERGLRGERASGVPLAEYRVHKNSMIKAAIASPTQWQNMIAVQQRRHPWLTMDEYLPTRPVGEAISASTTIELEGRLAWLLPILRCPETGGRLLLAPDKSELISEDRTRRWPILRGRPLLFPGLKAPPIISDEHLSNRLPASALALIKSTNEPILHLSAGGSPERYEHVVEAEAAIFRHTDLVADAHRLPFIDESFEAVIALNASEHYHAPAQAAHEILRVLRPGGRVLIRTAFLQPLHEAPWHFYNCTRYGLERWFDGFEIEKLDVSDNFHPGHSLAWLASDCEAALRGRLSPQTADSFLEIPIGQFVALWRAPEESRAGKAWNDLATLPQDAQEALAAGFELVARKSIPRAPS
jgi:SAM-dependent methyltransferase/uncharacterized protein YbaR (Trm112 family)